MMLIPTPFHQHSDKMNDVLCKWMWMVCHCKIHLHYLLIFSSHEFPKAGIYARGSAGRLQARVPDSGCRFLLAAGARRRQQGQLQELSSQQPWWRSMLCCWLLPPAPALETFVEWISTWHCSLSPSPPHLPLSLPFLLPPRPSIILAEFMPSSYWFFFPDWFLYLLSVANLCQTHL